MDEAQRDCRAEFQVARSMFSGLLRKRKSPQKCPGTRVTATKWQDFGKGCPESIWAVPDTVLLCLCKGTRWRESPGQGPQVFCLPSTAGHRVRKQNPKPPCFASPLQKQPISQGHEHSTLWQTSVMKWSPVGFTKVHFSQTLCCIEKFLSLNPVLVECLSVSRKKN